MPALAPDITPEELEKDVRDELRSLPNDLADLIASHLVAAERALVDEDAALAYEHAKVARRFAARIGVVREAVGLAAYRAGHYAEALSDLRAARRMTGSDEFLPIMADCERGLGRPERAIDLVRSPEAERLERAGRIELAIVESGARRDLGQFDAAVITLQRVPELRSQEPRPWSARLAFAYADALAAAGHEEAATDWFERAMMFDEDGETDAAERYAELTGAVIEDVEDLEEDEEDLDLDVDDLLPSGDVEAEVDEEPDRDQETPSTAAEPVELPSAAGGAATVVQEAQTPTRSPEPSSENSAVDDSEDDLEPGTGRLTPEEEEPSSQSDSSASDGGTRPAAGMAPAFIEPDFGVSTGDDSGDLHDGGDVDPQQRDAR